MNKAFIAAIIVLVLVIIGILLFFGGQIPKVNDNQENQPASVDSLVTVINNDVTAKIPFQADFKTVNQSTNVPEGSMVKTSSSGRALIEGNNSATVVDKNSQVVILRQSSAKQSVLALAFGAVWARVKNVFLSGQYLQIETPNAVATVRGTEFGVQYANGQTVVMVHKGSVLVISRNPQTKEQIGNELTVNENEKATIVDYYEPLVQEISAQDKRQEWYLFNIQDEEIKSLPSENDEEPVFCAQDLRQCPDGSYVGRVPPTCEFPACKIGPPVKENSR